MSTEYYLVCPEAKTVLQLYKKHQYLATLNGINDYKTYLEMVSEEVKKITFFTSLKNNILLNVIVSFLLDCSGKTIYHFDDNQWIDWWNQNNPDDIRVPGMTDTYSKEWTVYEY